MHELAISLHGLFTDIHKHSLAALVLAFNTGINDKVGVVDIVCVTPHDWVSADNICNDIWPQLIEFLLYSSCYTSGHLQTSTALLQTALLSSRHLQTSTDIYRQHYCTNTSVSSLHTQTQRAVFSDL